jgi:hypothetical protein
MFTAFLDYQPARRSATCSKPDDRFRLYLNGV